MDMSAAHEEHSAARLWACPAEAPELQGAKVGAGGGGRTHTQLPVRDFESLESAKYLINQEVCIEDFTILVPKEGVEPTHPYGYSILSRTRLPFRHSGTWGYLTVSPAKHPVRPRQNPPERRTPP